MTRIPDDLPYSSGFAATASTEPVVIACTTQKTKLKEKIQSDLAGICAENAADVKHVAYFSVHPVPAATKHFLQQHARKSHGVGLDVFAGDDLSTLLAEPDLIWVAEYYLDLPTEMLPPLPAGEPAPAWYADLLTTLRSSRGSIVPTPGQQAAIAAGMRHSAFTPEVNADLPEWIDFMAEVLNKTDKLRAASGLDEPHELDEMIFRGCYEVAIARLRGLNTLEKTEDLMRRALTIANDAYSPTIVADGAILLTYWGGAWLAGVASAHPDEISGEVARLQAHAAQLIADTDEDAFPVRACSLLAASTYLALLPNYAGLAARGFQPPEEPALLPSREELERLAGRSASEARRDGVDVDAAMALLEHLVRLLPKARPFSVNAIATVFQLHAPSLADHPAYAVVRDGLDEATALVEGDAARAERCRDRALVLYEADRLVEALPDLHAAKLHWFRGETMGGSIMTMQLLAQTYSELGFGCAAKQYAAVAAQVASIAVDESLRPAAADALLTLASHSQSSGLWLDAAALGDGAMTVRSVVLADPFDVDKHPLVGDLIATAGLHLAIIRRFWPELALPYTQELGSGTWNASVQAQADASEEGLPTTEEELHTFAAANASSRILGDVGDLRTIDFAGLGVVWRIAFANSSADVLAGEAVSAAIQIVLADIAPASPVLASTEVHVRVALSEDAPQRGEMSRGGERAGRIELAVTLPPTPDTGQDVNGLIAVAVAAIASVHLRPTEELTALVERRIRDGLASKVFFGRPYEDAARLLEPQHYARLSGLSRPPKCDVFQPAQHPSIEPAAVDGPGYDRDASLTAIRSRYQVAQEVLPFTIARLMSHEPARDVFAALRRDGWRDWHILSAILNLVGNERLRAVGVPLEGEIDIEAARAMMLRPEAEDPVELPLESFSHGQLQKFLEIVVVVCAQAWQLRPASSTGASSELLGPLRRRYHFFNDDIPHVDLLECVDDDGHMIPLV